jgi:hypothetical protein
VAVFATWALRLGLELRSGIQIVLESPDTPPQAS